MNKRLLLLIWLLLACWAVTMLSAQNYPAWTGKDYDPSDGLDTVKYNSYVGVMDKDGNVGSVQELLDKGQTTDIIVMKLAHTPASYCDGDLKNTGQTLNQESFNAVLLMWKQYSEQDFHWVLQVSRRCLRQWEWLTDMRK